jgi:hypothetical protein
METRIVKYVFTISGETTSKKILDKLKKAGIRGECEVATQFVLTITTDEGAECKRNAIKNCFPKLDVEQIAKRVSPYPVPKNTQLYYYFKEPYQYGEFTIVIYMTKEIFDLLDQPDVDIDEINLTREENIVSQVLETHELDSGDQEGNEYYYSMFPQELKKLLNEAGFVENEKVLTHYLEL